MRKTDLAHGVTLLLISLIGAVALLPSTSAFEGPEHTRNFTIAVVPDTQYYADYTRQRAEGFPFDAARIFEGQMREIERRLRKNGGDVAFVTSVGDVWQHPSGPGVDPAHKAMGMVAAPTPRNRQPKDIDYRKVRSVEIPAAVHAWKILDNQVPLSIVPGNHDYDAYWLVPTEQDKGLLSTPKTTVNAHFGGLDSFTEVFGDQSPFFKGKEWYVASFNRGADSAQVFSAGGYRFLHIGLEMDPPDDVLAWANEVVAAHPGLPVIVTTHDFLNPQGERKPWHNVRPTDVDPMHNDPDDIWNKFIRCNPNIFLVLAGHQFGEARRTDLNDAGGQVYQMLSDYQERRHVLDDVAGSPRSLLGGLGDGWMRFLTFDFSQVVPVLRVRTYSTYYHAYSTDLPHYATWYKPKERPDLSDADYLALGSCDISLDDFYSRFGTGVD